MLIFELLDGEYEYAPENKMLKTFYTIDENETDFYVVRNLIEIILTQTYLFFPDTALKQKLKEIELIKRNKDDENLLMYLRDNLDSFLHSSYTRILSLRGKEWASEILGSEHALSADLLNMTERIAGFFLYKGQDNTDIFLEHISTGKEFKLLKKSYDHHLNLKQIDTILFLGIVRWRKEWWFSGVSTQIDYNANIVLKEKNSLESRMQVNFLDNNTERKKEILKEQLDAFLDFNNGSPIAFLPSDEIEGFNKNFINYYNKYLDISKKERKKAMKRMKKNGYFADEENNSSNFSDISDSGLVFFNSKSGIEIALDVNSAFPIKNNPFYDAEESEDDIFHLLMAEDMSAELAMYCINNCKNKLPFFTEGIGEKYFEDIDFLLRFWKGENYYAKPSITLV